MVEQIGLPRSAFLFIGDSAKDFKTAEAAAMHSMGVTWGFREPKELEEAGCRALVDHPLEFSHYYSSNFAKIAIP